MAAGHFVMITNVLFVLRYSLISSDVKYDTAERQNAFNILCSYIIGMNDKLLALFDK